MVTSDTSDTALLALWESQACEKSFRILVERYAGLVHQVALRHTGDEGLAADVTQATFIVLSRKAGALTAHSALGGWLHVTALNQARNLLQGHLRESRKRRKLVDLSTGPDSGVSESLKGVLDVALGELSRADREALLLRYYRSLSVKEVASHLGLSVGAAQQRVLRATERLRQRLSSHGVNASSLAVGSALTSLASDAQAGIPLAPSIIPGVLSSSTTSVPFIPAAFAALIMTKKILIPSAAAVLLAGTIVYQVNRDHPPAEDAKHPAAATTRSGGAASSPLDMKRAARTPKPKTEGMPDGQFSDERNLITEYAKQNSAGKWDLVTARLRSQMERLTKDLALTPGQQEHMRAWMAERMKRLQGLDIEDESIEESFWSGPDGLPTERAQIENLLPMLTPSQKEALASSERAELQARSESFALRAMGALPSDLRLQPDQRDAVFRFFSDEAMERSNRRTEEQKFRDYFSEVKWGRSTAYDPYDLRELARKASMKDVSSYGELEQRVKAAEAEVRKTIDARLAPLREVLDENQFRIMRNDMIANSGPLVFDFQD